MLQIELTEANLDLLLEDTAESAPWALTIQYENMYWISGRSLLKSLWWCSKKCKYRHKSMLVLITSDMGDEDKDRAVAEAAGKLQDFRDQYHNVLGNMPKGEKADESDDEGSAEYAEPVQKKPRADCAGVRGLSLIHI